MPSCILRAGFVLFLVVGSAWAELKPELVGPAPSALQRADSINLSLGLKQSEFQRLALPVSAVGGFSIELTLEGRPVTLDLWPHSVRGPGFRVLVQSDASGELREVDPPSPNTYRGTIRGRADTDVRATIAEVGLRAVIYTTSEVFGIEPMSSLDPAAERPEHLIYRSSDWVNTGDHRCGVFPGAPGAGEPIGPATPPRSIGGTNTAGAVTKIAEIGIDSDSDFYQKNGSSIANTVSDIEDVMNAVTALYEVPGILITYEITTIIVRTVAGLPYTESDSSLLLNQFRIHMQSNPQSFVVRDMAHLFTGKNLVSNIIGIAYLGVVCNNSFGYGLSESRFTTIMTQRAALTAHETGHNWNAGHCDGCTSCSQCCRIMCSGIGGCNGVITSFGCEEITAISTFRNSRTCLSDQQPPVTLPFFEPFATGTLDVARWSYNKTGVIVSSASNPPSAPNAIELDTSGSELYRDDDLRTNQILLGSAPSARLLYQTQHSGVESGEQFVVEYYTSTGHWSEINRITSDGVNQTNFVAHSHALPANALHNDFRLRFRAEVSEANDNWFLDDVYVNSDCVTNDDCEDSNPCTDDVCSVGALCVFTNNSTPCDDGLFCTATDACLLGACVGSGEACPEQICLESTNSCVDCVDNPGCSDGAFCNGAELCAAGVCIGGVVPCVGTSRPYCDEAVNLCQSCLNDGHCLDAIFCDGLETCVNGNCVASTDPCIPLACDELGEQCVAPGTVYCTASSSSVAPLGTVNFDFFAVDVLDVAVFRTTATASTTSGTGSFAIACPGGVSIDSARPDYIYNGIPNTPTTNCGARIAQGTAAVGNYAVVGASPVYLATYQFRASADSTSGSTFSFNAQAGGSTFLRNVDQLSKTFNLGAPCVVTVQIPCDPPTTASGGSHRISITPAANLEPQALRIGSPTFPCVTGYVQSDGSFGPAPLYQTSAQWGAVLASSMQFVSSTSFEVVAECTTLSSAASKMMTPMWGDLNESGKVDVDDVICVLDGFGGVYTNCSLAQVDISPCETDNLVDVDDLVGLLGAFAGESDPCSPPCF